MRRRRVKRVLGYLDCAAIGTAILVTLAYLDVELTVAYVTGLFVAWGLGTQVTRLR